MRANPDIVVATPGRLLDLLGMGVIKLDSISFFVLVEAERMLDMGFIHDIRKVVAKLPVSRHNVFFSATMPMDIRKLANTILNNPVNVAVTPVASSAETVEQHIFMVEKNNKLNLLLHILKKERSEEHTSELQSLMRISYAVFCLKKKTSTTQIRTILNHKTIDNLLTQKQ